MAKKKNKKKKSKDKEVKGQLGKKKESAREKMIGQTIGYRYDVNLLPDYKRLTPFLKKYIEHMGWDDLNWLEDVHMGYEEDRPAVFDRNANGWVTIPKKIKLPNNQQDRDMIARELLVKFQMSPNHPLVDLKKTIYYRLIIYYNYAFSIGFLPLYIVSYKLKYHYCYNNLRGFK